MAIVFRDLLMKDTNAYVNPRLIIAFYHWAYRVFPLINRH